MQGADLEAGGAAEEADSAGGHLQVEGGVRHEIATFKHEKREQPSYISGYTSFKGQGCLYRVL